MKFIDWSVLKVASTPAICGVLSWAFMSFVVGFFAPQHQVVAAILIGCLIVATVIWLCANEFKNQFKKKESLNNKLILCVPKTQTEAIRKSAIA